MRLKTPPPSALEKTQATLAQLFTWLANDIGPEELQAVDTNKEENDLLHNHNSTTTPPH